MEFTLKLRSQVVIRAIQPYIRESEKVLDIGCGNGVVGGEIQRALGCSLTGTDVLSYLKRDIPFRPMKSPAQLDFGTKEFDFGLLVDVLHHIEYDTQPRVVQEALRVCKSVLIFEVAPTWLAKRLDVALNQIHNSQMNLCLTHRNQAAWQELFERQQIPCRFHSVPKPFLGYPFKNYLFVLGSTVSEALPA